MHLLNETHYERYVNRALHIYLSKCMRMIGRRKTDGADFVLETFRFSFFDHYDTG